MQSSPRHFPLLLPLAHAEVKYKTPSATKLCLQHWGFTSSPLSCPKSWLRQPGRVPRAARAGQHHQAGLEGEHVAHIKRDFASPRNTLGRNSCKHPTKSNPLTHPCARSPPLLCSPGRVTLNNQGCAPFQPLF